MIADTKTVFEHWTDEGLQEVADNPEAAEAGMLDGVRREIERRTKERERKAAADKAYQAAKLKIDAHKQAETRQREIEKHRAELLRDAAPSEQVNNRLAHWLSGWSRTHYKWNAREASFLLWALSRAVIEGKTGQLVELLRETEYADRWNFTHWEDPEVVVYFDEVFPKGKRPNGIPKDTAKRAD